MSRAREQVVAVEVLLLLLLLYWPAQHLRSRLCFIQDPGVFVKRQRLVDFLPAKPAFLGRPSLPSSRRRLPSQKSLQKPATRQMMSGGMNAETRACDNTSSLAVHIRGL